MSCGLGDIRRRIRKRSNLQTGSGRGRTDFRSVPNMRLVDLQACIKSQVAGSNRFRDIAFLWSISYPFQPPYRIQL